jgi:hypothetical protein
MPQAALRRDKRMSFGGGTIVAEPDTLPRSTCVFETRHMAENFIFVEDVILDAETRKSIAIIRNGQVFRADKEKAKIAVLVSAPPSNPLA